MHQRRPLSASSDAYIIPGGGGDGVLILHLTLAVSMLMPPHSPRAQGRWKNPPGPWGPALLRTTARWRRTAGRMQKDKRLLLNGVEIGEESINFLGVEREFWHFHWAMAG